ncbi:MAG: bifunctional DNA-formamidopyrimidine glycosylase/DNA-(apurinic or apyrimidinic site) lyase [Actinomycetota bacterium]|nr:bifunctional DNA-formamidopyrimidine glycosylase/DNA-(apurinic or apyrimidinic site) lyase [Actinomycetota bacterium]
MPELPEVETIRRQLDLEVKGLAVVASGSHPSAKFLPAIEVVGAEIAALKRSGKYLLLELRDGRDLIVHLGMTGQLQISSLDNIAKATDGYTRAWWTLDDGRHLMFRDVRRFGRLFVVPRGDHSKIPTLRHMGPEPFDLNFDGVKFWGLMKGRSQKIKTQLLSQRPIAGVGNIYADEALFLAGVDPATRSISLSRAVELLESIRSVLKGAIERGGTTFRDYKNLEGAGSNQKFLLCYGRHGEPCRNCGAIMLRKIVDARSTTWCSHCQKR